MSPRPTRLTDLPAISIRQPWAWAILDAGKDIENRGRRTSIRGPVLIHAAKTYDEGGETFLRQKGIEAPYDLPRGGIVGAVEIVDCVTSSKSDWFFGPVGYVLRNPVGLELIPCRGQVGFFKPELPPMRRRLHTCSTCGFTSEWLPGWTWYGSIMQIDNGKRVPKFCSNECRKNAGPMGRVAAD